MAAAGEHPQIPPAAMFEKRNDLVRFLAVAEAGRIGLAAERLTMTQPALTRVVARHLQTDCAETVWGNRSAKPGWS